MLTDIVLILILGALGTIGYFLKDAPKLFRQLKIENRRATNEKDIQREAYFRQISGKDLNEVFQNWTTFLTDMDKLPEKMNGSSGKKFYNDLITKTVMYGSEKTVHIVAVLSQTLYENDNIKNKVKVSLGDTTKHDYEDDVQGFETMLYIANIISSLKYDFTGYEVEPMELIATKLSDLDAEKVQSAISDAKKRVSKKLAEKNRW